MPSAGMSGIGLGAITGGLFLIYVGINNVPVLQAARDIMGGRIPVPNRKEPTLGDIDWDALIARQAGDTGNILDQAAGGGGALGPNDDVRGAKPVTVREAAYIRRTWPSVARINADTDRIDSGDHPRGLALDVFQGGSRPTAISTAIAQHYAGQSFVRYVSHGPHEWVNGRQRASVNSADHQNHVHISFLG